MTIRHLTAIALLFVGFFLAFNTPVTAHSEASAEVFGAWVTADSDGIIYLFLDRNGCLTGKVIGSETPGDCDARNPEPALRRRTILGSILFTDFKRTAPNKWVGGRIYNPEDGKVYRGEITLLKDGNHLALRGYIGTPLLGSTQIWTRHPAPNFTSAQEPFLNESVQVPRL
jgi:uncharacterized protein (DUF2147 family)